MPATLEFWFDFASTYSYPSAMRIRELAGDNIRWRPFLLGPIFRQQGWETSPFVAFPAKGRYMWRDLERVCATQGIPFRRPSEFPRNGLLAARIACQFDTAEWQPEFIRQVFAANFSEDRDIADSAIITSILARLGLDGVRIIADALQPDAKQKLREQTALAERLGIFGAPTFMVDGEMFWGNDRLEQAIAWQRSS